MNVARDLESALRDPHADHVWLLAPGVVPEPDALERLIDTVASWPRESRPVLAASRVVTVAGRLDPASVPIPEIRRPHDVLAAVDRGCVSLRAARAGSLLVRLDALRAAGIATDADARRRDLEWTARVLRRASGVLVLSSVAVRVAPSPMSAGDRAHRLASRVRALRALEPRERLWFAAHLLGSARNTAESVAQPPAHGE